MRFWRLGTLLLNAVLSSGDPATMASDGDSDQPPVSLGVAQASATPVLLSFLKELRAAANKDSLQASLMRQWCRDSKEQKAGLLEVLQRQLSEAVTASRKLVLESKRLGGEERLANLTIAEKEQQLKDAATTADAASMEFASEQKQMAATINAARKAIRVADSQAQRGHQQASGTLQAIGTLASASPGGSGLESGMAELRSASLSDVGSSVAGGGQSQGVLQTLNQLQSSMQQEQSSTLKEHNIMLRRFEAFADHLNSSIMEAQSQMAAIRTEAAQRKREQARLDGRRADLSAVLDAVQAGAAATHTACAEEEKEVERIKALISEESAAAAALLKQLHSGMALMGEEDDMPPLSLLQEMTTEGQGASQRLDAGGGDAASVAEVQGTSGSLVVTQEVEHEKRYQELGQYLLNSADPDANPVSDSDSDSDDTMGSALSDVEQFVKADAPEAKDAGGMASSAFRGIERFVADSAAVDAGRRSDARSRAEQEREEALARQRAAERQNQCISILNEGRKDSVALARSLERVNAKLNINKATALDYQRASAYVQDQQKLINVQLKRFAGLAADMARRRVESSGLLRGHAQRLLALATELDQQLSSDELNVAQTVRDLAQKVNSHQGALKQMYGQLLGFGSAVEAAERAILQRLADNMEISTRRLARLHAEAKVLSSLAQSKASTHVMGERFQEMAGTLCSKDRIQKLIE
mmetsp:Transcript_102883/g.286523  ORF Transcript_102883/g.286523 Transcript_102883/m.286523 type:complete len:703 (-) Transcript_102883:91-2199(-)